MELEVIREFRKTSQNTFQHVHANEVNYLNESAAFDGNNRKIRPTIYKTFLRVKSLDNDSKVCTFNEILKNGIVQIVN